MREVGTALVGCGSVASYYLATLERHPILRLTGFADKDDSRAAAYAAYYSRPKYESLDAVLADPNVELVLNLTNPRSHFTVSKACLEAGKHVYSEKPLAMSVDEAKQLVELAASRNLLIVSAPSRILAETAQTMWKALRQNVIGNVHAAYAEMDGGLIYRSKFREWVNEVGMPWPYQDEFEVGCTIEHAGYSVSWMTAFFGPIETVTSFATCQIPQVGKELQLEVTPPDLTVACLKFKSGLVARLTSSWIAPANHSIRVFGDTGILSTNDIWQPRAPVHITRYRSIKVGPKTISFPWKETYPLASPPRTAAPRARLRSPRAIARRLHAKFLHLRERVDFFLGPAELASAVREQRPCVLSPEYCLHNTEVVLAIHGGWLDYRVTTPFEPMAPRPWAL